MQISKISVVFRFFIVLKNYGYSFDSFAIPKPTSIVDKASIRNRGPPASFITYEQNKTHKNQHVAYFFVRFPYNTVFYGLTSYSWATSILSSISRFSLVSVSKVLASFSPLKSKRGGYRVFFTNKDSHGFRGIYG